MKHIRNITLLAAALFTLATTNSCSTSKKSLANSSAWLPTDFQPGQTVLLVQYFGQGANPITADMIAYMKVKYPFKYKFVSLEEIEDPRGPYVDANTYPYALVWDVRSVTFGQDREKYSEYYDLHFYNRKVKKDYPNTGKTTTAPNMTFKPVINTIVKKFG
jgi:hypothetical protein